MNYFGRADILLPKKTIDMTKWSVVACDQYTSEIGYWEKVAELAGANPSTLYLTLPEAFLEEKNEIFTIDNINKNMKKYLDDGIFDDYKNSYVFVVRTLSSGARRLGIVGCVDLEKYDYNKGSTSAIRATEGTVLERIPPRVEVRKDAPLELPHILLLIDDINKTVIEPLYDKRNSLKKLYDFDLMMDSGHIEGYLVDDTAAAEIDRAFELLTKDAELKIAVGDGNHSLATAKDCYVNKNGSRYALCELCNLHDDSLVFEAIYRVVFDIDKNLFLEELRGASVPGDEITVVTETGDFKINVERSGSNLPVGNLQNFLDRYIAKHGGRCDYIHGEDVVRKLVAEGNIGFLMAPMDKSELFKTVILDGALPRKTFSMGHAEDKRFYLEARKIKE